LTHSGKLRVALLSTAAIEIPGSMRAYADTLVHCLGAHAPGIEAELVELQPKEARGSLERRWQTISQPWRARQLRQRPHLWHLLDGSRACLVGQLPGAPVVVTVHDIIPWLQDQGRFPGRPRLGAAARRWWQGNARGLREASLRVCVSRNSAVDIEQAFGLPAERCPVVPLTLRPSLAAAALESPQVRCEGCVLHVGNNGFYKNRAGALRIFAKVEASIAKELVMAGQPPGDDLLQLATSLGIDSRVCWLIDPDDRSLASAYRRASLLLFPSLYEGFGWPLLEAMAFGLPIVASSAGSLPELLPDPALAVDPADEAAFARAVSELLVSPRAAEESASSGLRRAAEFSAARFGKSMADCYYRAANSHGDVHA
jgi:glycosyltransferase involved in cell wall biosynthesis